MNGKIMQSNNVLPFYISTTGKKVFQTGRVIVTMIGITSYFLLTIASDYCYKLSLDSSRFLQSSSSKERLIQHGMVFAIIDFLTRKVSMCFFSVGFIYFAASANSSSHCNDYCKISAMHK